MTQQAATNNNTTSTATTRQATIKKDLPAIGYFAAGLISAVVWVGGTAVQIQTSEAWMSGSIGSKVADAMYPHFSVFSQILAFWNGGLSQGLLVPYVFGWCVQAALILSSIGMELPKQNPSASKRAELFSLACILLIAINSIGDAIYAAPFGFWGAAGFMFALFVATFCFGMAAIMAVSQGIKAMR